MKILKTFAILGVAISIPLLASADLVSLPTTESTAQVSALPSNPMLCFDFKRTLTQGSTLYDVRALQYMLMQEGSTIPVNEYGTFGDATLAAVKSFQAKYASEILKDGSAPSGIVGRLTRAKLNALHSCSNATHSQQSTTQTGQSISTVSGKLQLQVKSVEVDSTGVTGTFCNVGSTDVPVFPLRIRLNGIIRDFSVTGATKAGTCESDTLPFATWGLTYDPATTYAVVTAIDPTGMYKSSQIVVPLNGTTTLAIPAIVGAHLSVRGVLLKSNGVQATLCNLGDTDITSFPVRVTVNGTAKDFDVSGAYQHGKCTAQTWTYDLFGITPMVGMSINALVNVDPNNTYKETNEFDNSAVISGTI